MENEKFKKLSGFLKALNKLIKNPIYSIVIISMLSFTITSCGGNKTEKNSQIAENMLEIYLEHDGKDFLNNVPEACKVAVMNNYNITEEDLEETISTFAYGLYGISYTWDFGIDDRQYNVTAKNISSETNGEVTLKELQNWGETKEFSTENNLNSWMAKDQTLYKIDSISKIWSDIYDVKNIRIITYHYDLDYIENRSGTPGCDENQMTSLTFVNYNGKWYCLEIMDIVVNGIEVNANNDISRKSWNEYFGAFQ